MNKILIVEDDRLVATIYRGIFLAEHFQVETARDGEQALELVRSFGPTAVLLDLTLPKMSGVELMKSIRTQPEFEHLPFVVLTNTYLTNLIREAWKAGATQCLSKAHCSPKQVISAVRCALRNNETPAAVDPSLQAPAALSFQQPAAASPNERLPGELRQPFIARLPSTLAALRALLQALSRAQGEEARLICIHDLYCQIRSLTGSAGLANLGPVAQMAEALEALLNDLYEKPKNLTVSPLRTVASAIDLLGRLFERVDQPEHPDLAPPQILVVDDEPISRRAITHALEKAKLSALSLEHPIAAYNLLASNRFDLIFLDVDMPGMDGFELCTKLRALPMHKDTPVIFVTSLDDFESRTSSMVSGGNDFIAKPFLFIELAVKALVYVLRGRLNPIN